MGVWVNTSRHDILASRINDFGTLRRLQESVQGATGRDIMQGVTGGQDGDDACGGVVLATALCMVGVVMCGACCSGFQPRLLLGN
jgi:hypothetical protein